MTGAHPPEQPRPRRSREARLHARRAAAESAAALRALLDAATLAAQGEPAVGGPPRAARGGARAHRGVAAPRRRAQSGDAVLRALADGLDAEIARWEAKSREDPEARSVLRAFLAVREVLCELGSRSRRRAQDGARGAGPPSDAARAFPRPDARRRPRRRVERVSVEG